MPKPRIKNKREMGNAKNGNKKTGIISKREVREILYYKLQINGKCGKNGNITIICLLLMLNPFRA